MARCGGCNGSGRCECTIVGGTTPTTVTTVDGDGGSTSPALVSTEVRISQAPPGGGDNLLAVGDDGLYVECAGVRGCLTGGEGIIYDPETGEIAAVGGTGENVPVVGGATDTALTTVTGGSSAADPYTVTADVQVADAPDNRISVQPGGGLYVPPADPPEIGCGLTGAGTVAEPVAVAAAGGEREWSADWACSAAEQSTLRCDPSTGEVWAPPEHYSAADTIYVDHFVGGWEDPIGPTGGWVIVDPGADAQFNIPANFLGNQCRRWSYSAACSAATDIAWTAGTTFEIGYARSLDGGGAEIRPLAGRLSPGLPAGRDRLSGTTYQTNFALAADAGQSVVWWPAVRVLTGSITIADWWSHATIHTTTQAD